MPRKEAAPFAADSGVVATFVVKRKILDEILAETENKSVRTRNRSWKAKASGPAIDNKSKLHHIINEKHETSHDAEGKKILEVITLVVHTLDKKHKIVGTLHLLPFSILSKEGKKDPGDLVPIPACRQTTTGCCTSNPTVAAGEGAYGNLSSGTTTATYQCGGSSGADGELSGLTLFRN